jgi:uncharacterized phage protein (TIGR01671 family)
MRELKFRIWDNLKKEWVSNTNIWRMKTDEFGIGEIHPNTFYWKQHPDGLTFQQYTGLLDKNGKMIFEGDIVHYVFDGASYPKEAKDEILICKWDQGNAWFVFVEDLNKDGNGYYWLEVRDRCEVIGNIFENKDLLKKEH